MSGCRRRQNTDILQISMVPVCKMSLLFKKIIVCLLKVSHYLAYIYAIVTVKITI